MFDLRNGGVLHVSVQVRYVRGWYSQSTWICGVHLNPRTEVDGYILCVEGKSQKPFILLLQAPGDVLGSL